MRRQKEYDLKDVPRSQQDIASRALKDSQKPSKKPPQTHKNIGCLGILAVVVVVLVYLFYPRATSVTVTGHQWNRSVEIEHYGQVQEEDWRVPREVT